MINNKVK